MCNKAHFSARGSKTIISYILAYYVEVGACVGSITIIGMQHLINGVQIPV